MEGRRDMEDARFIRGRCWWLVPRLASRELSRRGIGRSILAAYGDAVVPQITEAMGRAMVQVETASEFNRIGGHIDLVNSRECDLTGTWSSVTRKG